MQFLFWVFILSCSFSSFCFKKLDFSEKKLKPYEATNEDSVFIGFEFLSNNVVNPVFDCLNGKSSPPFDEIRGLINGSLPVNHLYTNVDVIVKLLNHKWGFIAVVAGSLLLGIIIPIVGCTMFICRCFCDRCTAKYEINQEDEIRCESCQRKLLTPCVFLFALILILCGSALIAVNFDMSRAIDYWEDSREASLNDFQTYVTNTQDQFQHAGVNGFTKLEETINYNFRDGNPLGDEILTAALQSSPLKEFYYNLTNFRRLLNDIVDDFLAMKASQTSFLEYNSQIQDQLNLASQKISEIRSDCADCFQLQSTVVQDADLDFNFSKPEALQGYEDLTLTQQQVALFFNIYNSTIRNVAAAPIPKSQTVLQEFNAAAKVFREAMIDYIKNISTPMNELSNITKLYKEKSSIEDITIFNLYRGYVGLGVAVTIIVVGIIAMFGMCFGISGYDSEATPAQRTGVSHCGGLLLIFCAVLCFMVSWLVFLMAGAGVFTGGIVEMGICRPLEDKEYTLVKHVVDSPNAINDKYEYIWSALTIGKSIQDLGMSKALLQCDSNKSSAYSTLALEEIAEFENSVNLDTFFTDANNSLNNFKLASNELVEYFFNDTLSSELVQFLETSIQQLLQNVNDSLNGSKLEPNFEFGELQSKLEQMISTMEAKRTQAKDDDTYTRYQECFSKLKTIKYGMPRLEASLNQFKITYDQFFKFQGECKSRINKILQGTDNFNLEQFERSLKFLRDGAPNYQTALNQAVEGIRARNLDYLAQYRTYITSQVKEEIGNCSSLSNAYRRFTNASCNHLLSSFNLFAFFLVIIAFVFLFLIFFSLKLSSHYKILVSEEPYDAQHEFHFRVTGTNSQNSTNQNSSTRKPESYHSEGVPLKAIDLASNQTPAARVLPIESDYDAEF